MAKKILVIDDEELIIRSLVKLLQKSEYEVMVAKTGQDALVIVEEEKIDLIISDIRMPGINGMESVKTIFLNLDNKMIPRPHVIFITGYANQEIELKAKALNPIDYIYKPFDIQKLLNQIKKVLISWIYARTLSLRK